MLSAAALLPLMAAVVSADTTSLPWQLNTHDTADCSDGATRGFTGQDILDARTDCFEPQFPNTTKSIHFRDSQSAAHILKLHEGESCSDSDEVISIPDGEGGVCVTLDSATGFSIARSDAVEVREVKYSGTKEVRDPTRADFYSWFNGRRQQVYAHAGVALAGCATGIWLVCGFGAVFTVIETGFLIFEAHRYTAHRAGKRNLIDEPVELKGYHEGKTVHVRGIDMAHELSRRDMSALMGRGIDEETHEYYQVDYVDEVTGEVDSVVADLDLLTNTTITSAPADSSKFGNVGTGHLAKRQSASDYTVHYQSMSMSERARDLFPITSDQATNLADEIWNWGYEQNVGGHCAALLADGERLNSGYFSIRTGGFVAHRDCENQ